MHSDLREGMVRSARTTDTSIEGAMKRRHPRQIADHTELRPGDKYALVQAEHNCDTLKTVVRCERATFVAALNNGLAAATKTVIARQPANDGEVRLTTHCIYGEITLAVWNTLGGLNDAYPFSDFLGDSTNLWLHQLIVPFADWDADPRVHVIDWINPDDVCEVALTWVEEEKELKRRRDIAMRRALGFE